LSLLKKTHEAPELKDSPSQIDEAKKSLLELEKGLQKIHFIPSKTKTNVDDFWEVLFRIVTFAEVPHIIFFSLKMMMTKSRMNIRLLQVFWFQRE
jgi:hypothetical protein